MLNSQLEVIFVRESHEVVAVVQMVVDDLELEEGVVVWPVWGCLNERL